MMRFAVARFARPAILAAVSLFPLLFVGVTGSPAAAHGAPDNPVSRAWACGPQGRSAGSAACRAAVSASGGGQLDWDNIRLPNVGGRDREKVPDGKLCSAGISTFKGLDLARTDWPTTTLAAGAAFTFTYRTTIPHQGTFRMYVTKAGYDATRPLGWADLETTPFLTAKDPKVKNAAYVMNGRLPAGLSGRHLIYTIWQNSSTPDTYYSCSDVVFTGGAPRAAAATASAQAAAAGTQAPASSAAPADPVATASGAADQAVATDTVPLSGSSESAPAWALAAGGAALVLGVVAAFLAFRRTRVARPPASV